MLYHYYMKINLKLLVTGLFFFFFLTPANAQVIVVKQDGFKVFLDTSEYNRTVSVGDAFKVITSQEKLVNPKTGKELGLVNHYSAIGKIIEVQPLYAIGEMPEKTSFTVGQEVVFEATQAPAQTVSNAAASSSQLPAPISNRKQKTYPVLEREVISAVQTDAIPFPGEEIATLDIQGRVTLFTEEENTLKEMAVYKLPKGYTPITLSAKDLMDKGHDQLFVTFYKEQDQKIATFVFQIKDNEFVQIATLPYFVKELGCDSAKDIYAQKPFIGATAKAGEVHELEYKNGRFRLEKDSFATRGHWLTGIAEYEIQNAETQNFVYTASNGRLRMRLSNGKYIDSTDLFGAAPNRVKYKQEIIPFYPSLQVYGPQGNATLAGIENTTKMGLLSEQFGQYSGGKIHFLQYENGSLRVQETVELDGFAYDTSCTQRGILVPQVLSSGQTVLTEIYR